MNPLASRRPAPSASLKVRFELTMAGHSPAVGGIEVTFKADEPKGEILAAIERGMGSFKIEIANQAAAVLWGDAP